MCFMYLRVLTFVAGCFFGAVRSTNCVLASGLRMWHNGVAQSSDITKVPGFWFLKFLHPQYLIHHSNLRYVISHSSKRLSARKPAAQGKWSGTKTAFLCHNAVFQGRFQREEGLVFRFMALPHGSHGRFRSFYGSHWLTQSLKRLEALDHPLGSEI